MDSLSLKGWLALACAAVIGRICKRAKQKKMVLSWDIAWEVPIAILCGFIGHGISRYMGFSFDVEVGVIATCSYLGPDGLEICIGKFFGGKNEANH